MALPQAVISGAANAQTLIYTVPDARVAAVSINVCALLAGNATIWIAPPAPAAVTDAHKIESGVSLNPGNGGVIERTQVVLPAGYRVLAASSVASGLACQVWGIEETV